VFCETLLLDAPFWLRKITTDPHILDDVNIVCPDDRYPKLNIVFPDDRYAKLNFYISELILSSHEYIPVAYVKMGLMI
jgi:hypothetical protein